VPSVAIENVFVVDYDCVVPEEVLSHRLGLVPLAVDADKLEAKNEEKADHTNTVVFKLHVACRKVL
jgi:DNA-directed RNA polymerases I and III subunit RPAC1